MAFCTEYEYTVKCIVVGLRWNALSLILSFFFAIWVKYVCSSNDSFLTSQTREIQQFFTSRNSEKIKIV